MSCASEGARFLPSVFFFFVVALFDLALGNVPAYFNDTKRSIRCVDENKNRFPLRSPFLFFSYFNCCFMSTAAAVAAARPPTFPGRGANAARVWTCLLLLLLLLLLLFLMVLPCLLCPVLCCVFARRPTGSLSRLSFVSIALALALLMTGPPGLPPSPGGVPAWSGRL